VAFFFFIGFHQQEEPLKMNLRFPAMQDQQNSLCEVLGRFLSKFLQMWQATLSAQGAIPVDPSFAMKTWRWKRLQVLVTWLTWQAGVSLVPADPLKVRGMSG
jgi:hypothetical protein